ncbi:hypothetical protein U1Q18_038708, partial [Sarracenia purpurea var. burkii]
LRSERSFSKTFNLLNANHLRSAIAAEPTPSSADQPNHPSDRWNPSNADEEADDGDIEFLEDVLCPAVLEVNDGVERATGREVSLEV